MLLLKNALGGVAAISSAAESSSARTYGSASARATYVGAVTPNVLIGILLIRLQRLAERLGLEREGERAQSAARARLDLRRRARRRP